MDKTWLKNSQKYMYNVNICYAQAPRTKYSKTRQYKPYISSVLLTHTQNGVAENVLPFHYLQHRRCTLFNNLIFQSPVE